MNFLKVVLPLLVAAWTIWGVFDYRKLKAALARGERRALIREYKITVAGELVGGILAVAAIGTTILQVDPQFNIELGDFGKQLMIGVLAGTVISIVVAPIAARKGKGIKVAGDIDAMIPRTSTEKWWFVAVALSAGVCEELIFRGFGLRVLNDLGLEGFALLGVGALVFGLAHVYQGPVGILATGTMGFALGMVYVTGGSLVWAMALHAALDLKVLLLGRVQKPKEPVT